MRCPSCGKSLWFRLPECPHCHTALPSPAVQRPWTVSLPCWAFFALGLFNLTTVLLSDWTPGNAWVRETLRVQLPLQYYLRYALPVLMMVLALLMLTGRNWARWVFVVWFGNSIFWQVVKLPRQAWLLAVFFALGALLLFLPRSQQFFTGGSPGAAPAQPPPSGPSSASRA